MTQQISLLKISGIILIIFGFIAVIIFAFGLILTLVGLQDTGIAESPFIDSSGIIIASSALLTVSGVLDMVFGGIGLKKYKSPGTACFFISSGIILSVLSLAGLILSISGGIFGITILGIPAGAPAILGTALPILYIVGGRAKEKSPSNK